MSSEIVCVRACVLMRVNYPIYPLKQFSSFDEIYYEHCH